MEENSELEEGEAHCYRDGIDNIDPDTDFSYIDEKLQNVLGHHLKDFEGGVSKEILGSKFGGYGSFLPAYDWTPFNGSHAKISQADSKRQKTVCSLSTESTSQNFQPISKVSSSVKHGTVSCSDHSLQNSKVPSGGDLDLSSARVAEKFSTKDESSSRSSSLTDQRTFKLRIKVSSDKMVCRNTVIYSGLGLDNSPSSSLGNTAEDSGGTNAVSRKTADESLTCILQDMTSFPVPGGVLISPLHDSLLCLIRKERLSTNSEHLPSLKGSQQHSAMSADKSVASMGNGKLLKEKKANLTSKIARPADQMHGPDTKDENDTASLLKKSENGTPGVQEINHNDLSRISPSNSECFIFSAKGTVGASEVSRGIDKDGVSHRLFSSILLVTEDSFESVSGQDNGKSQKNGKSRSVEKVSEQRGIQSHNQVLCYLGESDRYKVNKVSAHLKAHSGASTCNEDTLAPSSQKVGKKPSIQIQDEINLCSGRMTLLSEGKKSKYKQSREKTRIVSIKKSLKDGVGTAAKDTTITSYDASSDKLNKNLEQHKLKSQKANYKVRDIRRNSLDSNLEQTNNHLERPSSGKLNKKIENQVMSGPSTKDALSVGPSTVEGNRGTQMILAVATPVVINENWVCCDNCQKWRLLPFGTKPEDLPDNWLCSMLNWLPGMNRCNINEEETTKALYALYQLPVTEGQNNVQNYANGAASMITIDHDEPLDQKHRSPFSATVSICAKKRDALKEIPKSSARGGILTSNTKKNHLHDSVKCRSLKDTNQPPAESNVMKKFSSLHHNNSCNLDAEKHITKPKEKQMNGGDFKPLKMKKKRNADHHGYGSSKKAKIEDKYATGKHRNSDVDLGRVGLTPNAGLQTDAVWKNVVKYELSYSENAKCDTKDRVLLSKKKLGDQARVSSHGDSLDLRTQDRTKNSLKKRKSENNQNGHDSKEYVKNGGSESGLGREKKSRVQKIEGRDSSASKGADSKSNNRETSFISSKGHLIHAMEDVSVDKGRKIQKPGRKFASHLILNGLESIRRDIGSREVSASATSSSSKVSVWWKNRTNIEEVKGSPVESVSSSPFRTSYRDKFTSAAEDMLGKDDGGTDIVTVNNSCERCWDGEGNGEINQSETAMKEKDTSDFQSQPLKISTFDNNERNVNLKITLKSKVSSEFWKGYLLNNYADSFEDHQQPSDLHVMEHGNGESRGNQNNHEIPLKVDDNSFLQLKDSNRSCASISCRYKLKVSNSLNGHGDLDMKKSKNELDIDVEHNAHHHEIISEGKNRFPERSRSKVHKDEKNHISRDFERQMPSDARMEKEVVVKGHHDSDVKLCASTNREVASLQNLMQDLQGEVKATQLERETTSGMFKSLSNCESKHGGRTRELPGSQQERMFDEDSIDDSCKADVSKASKHPGNVGNKNGVSHSLRHHTPDVNGIRDLNCPSYISMKSSGQNATVALKEAQELRDYADRLKSSGFDFESNEAYFQAALKFLHGASLLETCSGEGGRNCEMTQVQSYRTTAKLSEFCAHEYEKREEMAAASLAYKCMEVAYMKVVYCKHYSTNRDRIELQATLRISSQGESPSSSASDVDNINIQVTADKATSSKGTFPQVAGNHVIVAQNRPNFIRLLDFTQDIEFAMEASRKSQNAFSTATVALEEGQNRDCITFIKRVIDFSFQDIEELLCLVRLAMEAINRSGFGGAKD